MENILDKIQNLSSVNHLTQGELYLLCDQLRETIKETVYERGGHLSSALGAVEVITALCNVYDFEKDKIVFDVGHQSYAYKILARGKERFKTLRTEGGESGFPDIKQGDYFIGGHAGNSISASLGLASARDLKGEDFAVVCMVGDASLFNGENLEALFASDKKPKNFVIVFKDNGMSIDENNNGAYKFFASLARKKGYKKTKSFLRKIFGNNAIGRFLRRRRSSFKRYLSPFTSMEVIGVKYYGVYDGHDLKSLISIFKELKQRGGSAFIHVKTLKGKGYAPAEQSSEKYHGIASGYESSENTFSNSLSTILEELAEKEQNLVAVTAGMKSGTGLNSFAQKYPDRFFDVGICEEHAVTMASGMALGGLKPIVCIYSTFLQRSYDQIITDTCMQNASVIFLLDRAGMVGSDGRTHQGLFDLSYLQSIPNLKVFAPASVSELKETLQYALKISGPVAIRYPNGENRAIERLTGNNPPYLWQELKSGSQVYLLAVGPRMNELSLKVASRYSDKVGVINARSIKPLDYSLLDRIKDKYLITLEENVKKGGFGESVLSYLSEKQSSVRIKILAVEDKFVSHASIESQLIACGLSEENLKNEINKGLL